MSKLVSNRAEEESKKKQEQRHLGNVAQPTSSGGIIDDGYVNPSTSTAEIFRATKPLLNLIELKLDDSCRGDLPSERLKSAMAALIFAKQVHEEKPLRFTSVPSSFTNAWKQHPSASLDFTEELVELKHGIQMIDWAYISARESLRRALRAKGYCLLVKEEEYFLSSNLTTKQFAIGLKTSLKAAEIIKPPQTYKLPKNPFSPTSTEEFTFLANPVLMDKALQLLETILPSVEHLALKVGYPQIVIYGHSVSGGLALLLALLLKSHLTNNHKMGQEQPFDHSIRVVVTGAPPVVASLSVAQRCSSFCRSIVNKSDIFPRLSYSSLFKMSLQLVKIDQILQDVDIEDLPPGFTDVADSVDRLETLMARSPVLFELLAGDILDTTPTNPVGIGSSTAAETVVQNYHPAGKMYILKDEKEEGCVFLTDVRHPTLQQIPLRRNVFGDHARHEYMKSLYSAISRLEEIAAKKNPIEQERIRTRALHKSSEKRIALSQHIVKEQTAGLQRSMTEWSASLLQSDDDEDDANQETNRWCDRSLLSPVLSKSNFLARHLEGDESSLALSLASSSATSTDSSQDWNKSKSGASSSASCGSSTSKRSKKKAGRRRKNKSRQKKKNKSTKAKGEEDGVCQSSALSLASVDSAKCSKFKTSLKARPSMSKQVSWKDQKPDALASFFQKQEKAAMFSPSCGSVSTADETACQSYASLHCRRVTEDDGDTASTESQTQDHQEFVPSPSEKRSIERQFSAMIDFSAKDSDDDDETIFSSSVSRQENHILKDLSSGHGVIFPTALGKSILREEKVLKDRRSSTVEDLHGDRLLELEEVFRLEEERLLQSLCLDHEIEFPCSPRFDGSRD